MEAMYKHKKFDIQLKGLVHATVYFGEATFSDPQALKTIKVMMKIWVY